MRLKSLLSAAMICCLAQPALSITIVQLNSAFTQGPDWQFDPADGTITIKTPSISETYVFWAHTGDGTTLASIAEIRRDSTLTSGTVMFKISKDLNGVTPGATDIAAITLDTAGIQTELQGLNITGDFLELQAGTMTLDTITSPVIVGNREIGDSGAVEKPFRHGLAATGNCPGAAWTALQRRCPSGLSTFSTAPQSPIYWVARRLCGTHSPSHPHRGPTAGRNILITYFFRLTTDC